ncbi:hypothetical protein SAMN05421538_101274 [Paracoccus isoporae]|uniref:Uncharacterized protein n=1 Tax=Paracoccus isoporae TaxID=591205 RepID=A0A1G6TFX1_9RHOB|nr:hypothetical protein [Paracoccus isoporae]SDD28052.1 hypothetical protein SAMN05421538_101274 [Paracoccus isoporae]
MTDRILALMAFAVLLLFLGILVWHVPQLDLGLVVLATLLLAGTDVLQLIRSHDRKDDVAEPEER